MASDASPESAAPSLPSSATNSDRQHGDTSRYRAFVSAPRGLQYALEQELHSLGIKQTKATPAGVDVTTGLEGLYRILLWSRIANRLVLELDRAAVSDADALYRAVRAIDWTALMPVSASFAVDFHGTASWLNNTTFGALRVKDALVDTFRDQLNERPSVNRTQPDVRVSVRLRKGEVIIGLDLSGESLHRRGYRQVAGKAPLKENLAAGMLWLAGWRTGACEQQTLVDPMCGSGTLLIEGAMIQLDRAPGLTREQWGFRAWSQHDDALWQSLVSEAEQRFHDAKQVAQVRIAGFDEHAPVVRKAWQNIMAAGLDKYVHVERRALEHFVASEKWQPGLIISNPPYGERLGEQRQLRQLYQQLGKVFESNFKDWRAAVLTGNAELGRHVGWRSHKQYKIFNGALESLFLLFDLKPEARYREAWASDAEKLADPDKWRIAQPERAAMLANRLQKNLRSVGKWAKQQGIDCYRLYDADMPEYAFALDIYRDEEQRVRVTVQEYQPPRSLPEKVAHERLLEALAVIRDTLDVDGAQIYLKQRQRQKGAQQYEKQAQRAAVFIVKEYDARIQVNLSDYLDTGLFLDHRPVRRWLNKQASGQRLLNLFCYTGVVSLQAALGGATHTTNVDMSNTYLNWAQQNFALNGLDPAAHRFVQADCMEWLAQHATPDFDWVFLDPPSFSNSKRMAGVLDIQRDHVELITKAMQHLKPSGTLIFSNNLQKFSLDSSLRETFQVEDWQAKSLDKDFARNSKIHHCWLVRHR